MSAFEWISVVVASAGGAGVLVAGLGAWLGRIWAARFQEADRARHLRELEELRTRLQLAGAQQQRISEAQFELYSDVWGCLQEVKTLGDVLWERASIEDVQAFVAALSSARSAVNRGRLILEDRHYQGVLQVLASFEEYRLGKTTLLGIRSRHDVERHFGNSSESAIREQIDANSAARVRYERLLAEIVTVFRHRLGLAVPSSGTTDQVSFSGAPGLAAEPLAESVVVGTDEVELLVAELSANLRQTVEASLLALEVSLRERALLKIVTESQNWQAHVSQKLMSAGLQQSQLLAHPQASGDFVRGLEDLADEENWTEADAIANLRSSLPDSVSVIVREFLRLDTLDEHHWFGWHIQVKLAMLLAVADNPLVLRAFATVLRSHHLHGSSLAHELIDQARLASRDPIKFHNWFQSALGRTYQEFLDEEHARRSV